MKKIKPVFILVMILTVLSVVLAACSGSSPATSPSQSPSPSPSPETPVLETPAAPQNPVRPERTPQLLPTGSGVTVIRADEWESAYPDIHASYMRNGNNSEHYSYTEAYPYITVLYEGMGFAFDYNSARGHVYSLTDLDNTGRPHLFANCFACKTPDMHALIAEIGDEAYAAPYSDLLDRMVEPVSCFNCHANDPEELIVTHQYVAKGFGDDFNTVSAESLSCAQCHVEYYFDPETRAVILPYSSLSNMDPDSILEYYNNLTMPNGLVYADYVNPRSGVRQIKVQHPEFETYYGAGSHHKSRLGCADCHMGFAENDSGERFVNHEWMSPIDNQIMLNERCSRCHTDLEYDIREIQAEVKERTNAIGAALAELMEDLVLAVDSGDYTEEELDQVRMKFRDAQFYWDFVFVENSNGAHNSELTHQVLDKAETLCKETKALLDALTS